MALRVFIGLVLTAGFVIAFVEAKLSQEQFARDIAAVAERLRGLRKFGLRKRRRAQFEPINQDLELKPRGVHRVLRAYAYQNFYVHCTRYRPQILAPASQRSSPLSRADDRRKGQAHDAERRGALRQVCYQSGDTLHRRVVMLRQCRLLTLANPVMRFGAGRYPTATRN